MLNSFSGVNIFKLCDNLSMVRSGMFTHRRLAAFIVMCFALAPVLVCAACPPLSKPQEKSFLEQLAEHAPKDHPLTDADLLKLLRSGDINLPPLTVFPLSGPAPLDVDVRWNL